MNRDIERLEYEIQQEKYHLCELSLYYFFLKAWEYMDPDPLIDNWHLGCIAEHLQAQSDGVPELRNLIINVQPRASKSKIVSVAFPAWRWLTKPEVKFLTVSHSDRLIMDHIVDSRNLMYSEWYSTQWIGEESSFQLSKDSNTKRRFDNNVGGYRIGTTPKGTGAGFGYEHLIMDDPQDLMDIYSVTKLEETINYYKGVLRNRANNPKTARKTLVQQRLGELDLTQWLLDNEEGWFHLVLPSEYEKKYTFISPIGSDDPREKEGELLCPQRFDENFYYEEKKDPYRWAALYQQRPAPVEGAIIKKNWIRYYTEINLNAVDMMLISVDLALEDKDESDYCVMTVWAKRDANLFLIDMIREKMMFQQQLLNFVGLTLKYPIARSKLVEKKATGSSLIQMLQNKISGLIEVNPIGSKEERLYACVPEFVGGNIHFPMPDKNPWVKDVIAELCVFPKGKNDDIVDSVTMAINYMALQAAQAQAMLFGKEKNSRGERLLDFNNDFRYKVVSYSRGSVKKLFS